MQQSIPLGTTVAELGGRSTLVAIGNFDGVHLGHQAVLAAAAQHAAAKELVPVALTFEPHPTVAIGRPSPACLTTVHRKVELLERIDPELRVVVQHFDAAFAAQSPEQFVRSVLVDKLRAKAVRVGENFRFGAGRRGDLAALVAFGELYGFVAESAPLLGDDQGRYSSTRVRTAIARGELNEARQMLTRPHSLSGQVIEGQRRARSLGFPTANLAWVREALPPHGVYAVAIDRLDDAGHGQRLGLGVCNIGVRPTVDAGFAVEVHVFDLDEQLYGQHLRMHLLDYLRPEQKFTSLDQLRQQIAEDARQARRALEPVRPAPDAGKAWF